MKKLVTILLSVGLVNGAFGLLTITPKPASDKSIAEKVVKYIAMEQKHSSAWLDYAKNMQSAKMDLKKKHFNEEMDVVKANVAKLGKGLAPEQYLQEQLNEMIALDKKQMEDWRAFRKTQDTKAQELAQKEESERASFEAAQ
jgi:selenocysteine-specific translation elongation factor